MADQRDPNQELPGRSGWRPVERWPDDLQLPANVARDDAKFYAYERVYANGRHEWVFFQRGKPLPSGELPQDSPIATVPDRPIKSVEDEWNKEQEQAAKPPETRNINGVPHVVTGRDEQGQPIWSPVQTATGPATAASPGGVPGNAVPRIEGTPDPLSPSGFNNNAPIMVWRTPDGKQVDAKPLTSDQRTQWEQAQGIAPSTKPAGPKGDLQTINGHVMEFNPATNKYDIDHGPTTAPKPPEQPQTVATNTTEPFIVERMPDGSMRTRNNPNYKGPAPEKGTNLTVKGGDGKTYIIPVDANGNAGQPRDSGIPGEPPKQESRYTSTWIDKDTGEVMGITRGAHPQVEVVPRAGQGQGAKPAGGNITWPTIAVGMSQDSLRTAYDEIQAAVDAGKQTPAWGENRRKEVMEAARLTVTEAQLHENSRQFNQSQAESLATTKLNYGQTALRFAMQSALQINGKLKQGSSAGADLFRSLFLMQMQMARDSGIYGITPGGGQSSVGVGMGAAGQSARAGNPQTRPPMPVGDKEKMAAHADQQAANIQAGLEGSGAPREYTPGGSAGAVLRPASTGAAPPPVALPGASAPAPVSNAPSPPPAAPATVQGTAAVPGPPPLPAGAPTMVIRNKVDGRLLEIERSRWPQFEAAYVEVTPPAPAAPTPQAMTPPTDTFPALEALRMQPTTQQPQIDPMAASDPSIAPPNPADPLASGELSPAIRAARIAATPPWKFDPAELPALVDEYGHEAVFADPLLQRLGAA